jgi:hypothetical protein
LTEEKLRPEVRAERRLLFMNDHINEISWHNFGQRDLGPFGRGRDHACWIGLRWLRTTELEHLFRCEYCVIRTTRDRWNWPNMAAKVVSVTIWCQI